MKSEDDISKLSSNYEKYNQILMKEKASEFKAVKRKYDEMIAEVDETDRSAVKHENIHSAQKRISQKRPKLTDEDIILNQGITSNHKNSHSGRKSPSIMS